MCWKAKGIVQGFDFDPTKVANGRADGGIYDECPMPVRWIYVLQDGTYTVPDSGSGTVARWTTATDDKKPTQTNPIVGRIAFWTDDDCSKVNINTAAGFVNTTAEIPPGYTSNPTLYPGSYWDTPRFYTTFDYGVPYPSTYGDISKRGMPKDNDASGGLALTQLLQGEYQRYPGHPATTSLGGIFGAYLSSHDLWRVLPRTSTANYEAAQNYNATTVNPFSYGSDGGVRRVIVGPIPGGSKANNQNLLPKTMRLYASVDELLFAAIPGGPFDPKQPTYQRQTNDSQMEPGPPRLTPEHLDKLRFFLTASSRAPELNLFGRPRVSVWPVRSERNDETVTSATLLTTQTPNIVNNRPSSKLVKYYPAAPDNGTGLNPYDKVMLFCSTIGTINWTTAAIRTSEFGSSASSTSPGTATGSPGPLPYRYIFFRKIPYLARDKVSVAAGTLPTVAQQELLADITLPRNRFLLETYLSSLTSQNIPGFGGNLKAKLDTGGANNRDALLVEIFDYVRCANMQDTTTIRFISASDTSGDKNRHFAPRGLMAPSMIEFNNPPSPYPAQGRTGSVTSMGLGRFPTIYEASLVFYYAGPTWKYTAGTATEPPKVDPIKEIAGPDAGRPKYRQMRAFLLLSTFNPMFGYSPMENPATGEYRITYEVKGLDQFRVTVGGVPYPLNFPSANYRNKTLNNRVDVSPGAVYTGRNMGGYEGFIHTLFGVKYGPKTKIALGPQAVIDGARFSNLPVAFRGGNPARINPTGITAASNYTVPLGPDLQEYYEFQTSLFTPAQAAGYGWGNNQDTRGNAIGTGICVPVGVTDFNFTGGKLNIKVWYDEYDDKAAATERVATLNGKPYEPIQTFEIEFKDGTGWQVPKGDEPGPFVGSEFNAKYNTSLGMRLYYWTGTGSFWPDVLRGQATTPTPPSMYSQNTYWYEFYDKITQDKVLEDASFHNKIVATVPRLPARAAANATDPQTVPLHCGVEPAWVLAARIFWAQQNSWSSDNLPGPSDGIQGPPVNWYGDRWRCIVQPGDTVKSMLYCDTPSGSSFAQTGDLRIGLITPQNNEFQMHPDYKEAGSKHSCNLRTGNGSVYFVDRFGNNNDGTKLGNLVDPGGGRFIDTARAAANLPNARINNGKVRGVIMDAAGSPEERIGDFDQGIGVFADGPYANKPDEGNVVYAWKDPITNIWYYPIPYFEITWTYEEPGDTFTSPLRQMPSPAMIGSLPRRPVSRKHWETLCFSPVPSAKYHPGLESPRDHLILDLFTMPIVEPYPISEPFSTAGKINLNYKIMPFNYITRDTGLRAALAPIRVTGVDTEFFDRYKTGLDTTDEDGKRNRLPNNFRYALDANKPINSPSDLNAVSRTIKEFEDFFDAARIQADPDLGIFKSASQICDMKLWPEGYTNLDSFWATRTLTGDNMREKPYADLYPRLTTKSNTYTVHFRVQTLRQIPRNVVGSPSAYAIWEEGKDTILGEYRGATTLERYIDPSDTRLNKWLPGTATPNPEYLNPDSTTYDKTQEPATSTSPLNPTRSLELIYRFRTVMNKKFAP